MAIQSAKAVSSTRRLTSSSGLSALQPRVSDLIGVALIVVGAAVLRFLALGHQSFWYDESVTVWIIRQPGLDSVLTSVAHSEATPPLYYIVAWGWGNVFGTGEAGMRALSAVVGLGAVPAVWAAGRRLIGPRGALVAAGLVAVNPTLVWYSQEARSYSLLVLFSALSFLFFARLRQQPTRANGWGWAVTSALALLTHYFAAFIVAVELLWLLIELRAFRRLVVLSSLPIVVVGLALVPLAYYQEKDGRTAWIASESLGGRIGQVFHELSSAGTGRIIAGHTPPHGGLGLVSLIAVLAALALTCFAATGRERVGAGVATAIGGGSILAAGVMALVGVDFFLDRNLIGAWIPLALVPAAGLAARRTLPLGLALAGAICGLGVAADVQVTQDHDLQRQDWRAVARSLGPATQTRALAVVPAYYVTPLQVYGQKLPPARPGDRVREVDLIGSLPSPPPGSGVLPGFHLTQTSSFTGGLRVARYTTSGLLTLTANILRALPGRVTVQPGRRLLRWLGQAITQVRRWQQVARILRLPKSPAFRVSLLDPIANARVLLNPPPEVPRNPRVRAAMARMLAAAARLRASGRAAGPAAVTFQSSLSELVAVLRR